MFRNLFLNYVYLILRYMKCNSFHVLYNFPMLREFLSHILHTDFLYYEKNSAHYIRPAICFFFLRKVPLYLFAHPCTEPVSGHLPGRGIDIVIGIKYIKIRFAHS